MNRIVQALDRLDDMTGATKFSQPPTQEQWDRNLRVWWLFLLLAPAYGAFMIWVSSGDSEIGFPVLGLIFSTLYAFTAGFFYAHRLRARGKRSWLRIFRAPWD